MQPELSERSSPRPDGSNKRRRTSGHSTVPEPSESSNALPAGRRTLTTSSPQRGSSREMTPPESSNTIKYTRTGRVSKAAKGQRVHHCDDCGKVSACVHGGADNLTNLPITTFTSLYAVADMVSSALPYRVRIRLQCGDNALS